MYILGLNAFHWDASACIYHNEMLVAAAEEERFNRTKHWSGLPVEAIKFCLKEAAITIEQLDYITVGNDPTAKLDKKLVTAIKKLFSFDLLQRAAKRKFNKISIKQEIAKAFGISDFKAQLKHIEHHRSHLASAFYPSPFEVSAIVSIDAFGDFTSTMRAIGKGNTIEVIDSVSYPHSIGMFYTAFTQLLGFQHVGDEYKVMGLAPYGQPKYVEQIRDVITTKNNGLFELNTKYFSYVDQGVDMQMKGGQPFLGNLFSNYMEEKFGKARDKSTPLSQYHKDMAASIQTVAEEIIFHLLNDLQRKTGLDNVCVAGGCAQNSVANGKIIAKTNFKNLFVPPAGHDAGTSVGSALYLYHQELDKPRSPFKHQAYTGAKFSDEEIETCLKENKVSYVKLSDDDIFDNVTDCLINGGVAGWFQGRAEFGPRALGNRSIIADPRRNDAKEILNTKIKRRESFRPFAPSILREHVADYFEIVDSVPFMEKVFPIKPEKQKDIPAVTHVDGTGRLQSVEFEDNPRYYLLIKAFYKKTGVPILLNTSFNENEPIVNTPKHALDCYLRTKMDMLILENYVVRRDK
jgi:carbamoyltransferase